MRECECAFNLWSPRGPRKALSKADDFADIERTTKKLEAIELRQKRLLEEIDSAPKVPAGLTGEAFSSASAHLRKRLREVAQYGDFGDDIFVHGSRAVGKTTSDLDIGIRVTAKQFDDMIEARLKTLTPGSDTWKTLQVAKQEGRIFAGEIGISGVRKEIQRLLGIDVDLSVIRAGGKFDNGPYIPLP